MYNEKETSSLFILTIDEDSRYNLKEMAKWARFLGIIGFIAVGLLFIAALFSGLTAMSKTEGLYGIGMIFGLIIGAFLYLYPVLTFYRFGLGIKKAMLHNDQLELNTALRNLKNCFKYMGIMAIVLLSIYGIIAIVLLITAASI